MRCIRCQYEVEEDFQFCPKCGSRRRRSDGEPKPSWLGNQKSNFVGITLALILFAGGLTYYGIRQHHLAGFKQGKRSGLEFAEWLATQKSSAEKLQRVLGRPRTTDMAQGRSIRWFQINDGILGVESVGGAIHFRPARPVPAANVPSHFRAAHELAAFNGEVVTSYEGPANLALIAIRPEKKADSVSEFILWRKRDS
jgi:hypothetical protein